MASPKDPDSHNLDGHKLVQTPLGSRSQEDCYILRPGEYVSTHHRKVTIMDACGKPVVTLGEIGKGSRKKVKAGAAESWIVNAQCHHSREPGIFECFRTKWIVPDPPTLVEDQSIYLSCGMQPTSGADILHSVLQWGYNGVFGGNFWCITSWYAVAGPNGRPAVFTPYLTVYPGDELQGLITCTGNNGSSFQYMSSFVDYDHSRLILTDHDELTGAYTVLEGTGISRSEHYPRTRLTSMRDITIRDGIPGQPDYELDPIWSTGEGEHLYGLEADFKKDTTGSGIFNIWYRGKPLTIDMES